MKKLTALLILTAAAAIAGAKPPAVDERENELVALKGRLSAIRDSLQREIAQRWRDRQHSVERREVDKEEIARLTEQQEKVFNAAISAREEGYALERQLEGAQKTLDDKKQEWRYFQSVLNDLFEKEADQISGFFPLDVDSARSRLETIRRDFTKKNSSAAAVGALADYAATTIRGGTLLSTMKTTLLPDGEEARVMTVARFGTVFGYGMSDDGAVYTIGQSGREGADRYRIRKIENPLLQQRVAGSFSSWIRLCRPQGSVTVDIVQSDLSGMLISGRTEDAFTRAKRFFRAGGPVMVPLGLLPLWALVLALIKLAQFAGRRARARSLFSRTVSLVEKNDTAGARALLATRGGGATLTAAACLDAPSRSSAEHAAEEVLAAESARLGSHLNTLAVIAGVAPLLGLLGTVTGMIRLFEVITRFGTGDPKLLAGGISEALITTEVGLIIAVPVLLIHNFLRNSKNRITAELRVGALRIINRLFPEN